MSTTVASPSSAPASSGASSAPSVSSSPSPASASPAPSSSPSSSQGSQAKQVSDSTHNTSQPASQPQDKAVPGETPAETAERKYKLKINGVEKEYGEAEVIRRAQHFESADQKFQDAAKSRKQVESFLAALKSNPMEVLANPNLGFNFREIAEQYLAKEYRQEMMSPEQQELEELRSFKSGQMQARDEAEQARVEADKATEFNTMQAKYAQDYDRSIRESLDKSGLPRTPQTLRRVAEVMHAALKKGYELDVHTAVDMVRDGYSSDVSQLFGQLDGEKLMSVLGEDLAKKIRTYDLQRLKAKMLPPPSPAPTPTGQVQPRESSAGSDRLSPSDWIASLRKKAGVD